MCCFMRRTKIKKNKNSRKGKMTVSDGPVSNSEKRALVNGPFETIERNFESSGSYSGDDILSRSSIVKPAGFKGSIDPALTCSPIPLQKALPCEQTSLYVFPSTTFIDIGNTNNSSTTPAVLLSDCDESFASDHTSMERHIQKMGVFSHGQQSMQDMYCGEDLNEQIMPMSSTCSIHPGSSNICPHYDVELDLDTIFDDQ